MKNHKQVGSEPLTFCPYVLIHVKELYHQVYIFWTNFLVKTIKIMIKHLLMQEKMTKNREISEYMYKLVWIFILIIIIK
jgi:hypothetical protein